ncbi:N-acetylglucosamine-6-phosphate deacetylase [Neocloeon triangulifer]|uniref:N-acetylglucosamine-6-phosphate deacetylase n=1 Tax=Neocloeon triangulifer TaxID=2078957 RepID=UPI00286F955E|nr:N-acetylglucosamine-6-phosphate deacetylase [Neocloeon triangulifer]
MASRLVQFVNCRLLRDHTLVKDDLWVRDGKIENPETLFFDERVSADLQVDCQGAIVAPGFIDLQINGGFGVDFSHDVAKAEQGVAKVAKGILAHGVTSFCPTLVTSPEAVYHRVLPTIQTQQGGKHGATVLGVHLEGPFISPMKKGAHPAEFIRTFAKGFQSVLDVYGGLDNVSIVTLAPELKNASEVVEELSRRNVTVSVGHSMGDLVHGEVAVQHGATFITHLFNAMLPFHHRDPGIVGLLTSDAVPEGKTVFFGIIADGIHTHPAALRIAHRTHPNGLVLVTDAISALGLQEGTHQLGQMAVEVRNSHAYVAGTTTLCGSIASMIECVQHFAQATGCSMVSALEAASLHAARAIGIHGRKGTLNFGADADFIFLGEDYSIWSTWIAGECVYSKLQIMQ